MITAIFENNQLVSYSLKTWQYDYGQILRIEGLNLPTAVEIHFSLTEKGGEAVTRVGMTKDGVTDVVIPDSFLENNGITRDYQIYAFVYLRDDTSGQTEYKIPISVTSRPKPEAFDRPEDGEIFKEAIQEVRQSADQAVESARQAGLIKDSVQNMVDTIGNIDEQVQAVKEFAEKAETASSNAALSEKSAKKSETSAELSKTAAEESAESAKQSEAAVETARQEVATNKTAVEQAVSGFDEKVVEANIAIENAKTGAVKAVEDKGNEVLQSIPPDFETQMANKVDKQQGIENKGKALVVGEDGNVTVGEVQGGDGIPIINTMSGESPLVVPDSAERVDKGFELLGKSEQATTTGVQLITLDNRTDVGDTELGGKKWSGKISEQAYSVWNNYQKATVEFLENNSFKLSHAGTGSANGNGLELPVKIKQDTDYTLSYGSNISEVLVYVIQMDSECNKLKETYSRNKKYTFHSEANAEWAILKFTSILNSSYVVNNVQFEEGTVATPYEPYTGGKPSPSPEYPQEIKSVGKWNEDTQKYEVDVKVTGKNLFDKEKIKGELPVITHYYIPIYVKKGAKVSVSCKKLSAGLEFYALLSKEKGVATGPYYAWVYHSDSANLINDKITFKAEADVIYFNFSGNKENMFEKLVDFLQIEISDAPTPYQPYKEQTLTITSDRPITKWDKLVEQDGQIGWLYGAKRYVVTGSELWMLAGAQYYSGISTNMYTDTVTNFEKAAVCERLKYKDTIWSMNDKQGFCLNATNQLHIRFFNEILGVADEATKEEKQKAYVTYLKSEYEKGTPYEIVYKSTDTEFIPLPQSEQEAIRALTTYYPTTVITVDGGEVAPNIEVTYTADTKNYIDQKIEAINKAIVTTQKALL